MVDNSIIKVSCGPLKGKLHKSKFYCPGIHRECIEYQGRFVTPKMFSVIGEKSKLKDWKNAVRINGIQLRKYIDSGQLDFHRHEEFCTGRCIPRSPVNRNAQVPPTSSVPKVEFVSSINEHTYCHLPDDSEKNGSDTSVVPVDIKPNMALLQSLLERPVQTHTAVSNRETEPVAPMEMNSEVADDRQFWIGIIELGLMEHFFREIKATLDLVKMDLVTRNVRNSDAQKLNNVVRELGLMNKFKHKLASFKSDMDRQQEKLDKEMEELKSQVAQFELRKQALKRKSEKFEFLMEMSQPKRPFQVEPSLEDMDEADKQNNGSHNDRIANEGAVVGETSVSGNKVSISQTAVSEDFPPESLNSSTEEDTSDAVKEKSVAQPKMSSVTQFIATKADTVIPKIPAESGKKVTIIRQVLMEASDEMAVERMREATVQKLKKALAAKQISLVESEATKSDQTKAHKQMTGSQQMTISDQMTCSQQMTISDQMTGSQQTTSSQQMRNSQETNNKQMTNSKQTSGSEQTANRDLKADSKQTTNSEQKTNSEQTTSKSVQPAEEKQKDSVESCAASKEKTKQVLGDMIPNTLEEKSETEQTPEKNTCKSTTAKIIPKSMQAKSNPENSRTNLLETKSGAIQIIVELPKTPAKMSFEPLCSERVKKLAKQAEVDKKKEPVEEEWVCRDKVMTKTEIAVQTPIEGVRENPPSPHDHNKSPEKEKPKQQEKDSAKPVSLPSRRSKRKTSHLSVWGTKQDKTSDDSQS